MNGKTILVIDDSTTIRRLADSTLSRAGYAVLLAANAEDGLRLAADALPDLILLDHQLPGTTGFEVCKTLLEAEATRQLPVVISSTLRKRAYVEYADMPNVVDMLPKPYTEELLVTTTVNSLDTGSLVVESQELGTAVPEVIDELGESDLGGTFSAFSIREVIDFLNNGRKAGVLEVEAGHNRYWICLENGRVQGITATGVETSALGDRLPDTLKELAPVLKLTVRGTEDLEGLIDLLNTKVVDPRLLRRLLRHQAAVLISRCFTQPLKTFRFESNRTFPSIYQRLALDVSVLALLIEGAMTVDEHELPQVTPDTVFERLPIRGQNLDRAGLSAHQTRALGRLTSPRTVRELASDLDREEIEIRRILHGLEQAGLVAPNLQTAAACNIVLFESNVAEAERLHTSLQSSGDFNFQVVSDQLAIQLLLKRNKFTAVIVDCSDRGFAVRLRHDFADNATHWLCCSQELDDAFDIVLEQPLKAPEIIRALNSVMKEEVGGITPTGIQDDASTRQVTENALALIEEPALCQ